MKNEAIVVVGKSDFDFKEKIAPTIKYYIFHYPCSFINTLIVLLARDFWEVWGSMIT
jgi:hypothetical protein